jgi:acetylornithine deacetylase
VDWEVPFRGEPLPAGSQDSLAALGFCKNHQLPLAEPVDFWTEASVFSAAGLPALVLGPGDIAQAHVSDEWVELEQLETACELYRRVVNSDG